MGIRQLLRSWSLPSEPRARREGSEERKPAGQGRSSHPGGEAPLARASRRNETLRERSPNEDGAGRNDLRRIEQMARMKRGVGYCENTECEDYAKGVFLLNHGDTFYCPRCRQLGKVEKERGFYTGNSDIFKEVRVEYNFDPIHGIYREIAIVRDESLWGRNNVYTLQSPLIKTEKRALKVSEAILANLNRYRGLVSGDDIPRTTEIILSFDEPFDEFSRRLTQLSKEWEASGLREISH
jgi:ribosomal protein S27AE